MGKRIVIGLVAMIGLVAIWQTDAEAQCLSWRTIGGSSMCVAWATKGVQCKITFKDGCFVSEPTKGGTVEIVGCQAECRAKNTDNPTSIAFCSNGVSTIAVECNQEFSFGPAIVGSGSAVECVEHPDNESPRGEAHERHRCVAAATLPRRNNCDRCCDPAFNPNARAGFTTCVDQTPVEMHTRTEITYVGGGSEVPSCSPGAPDCQVEQTCSINPKKIALITDPNQGRQYQCNLDCMGDACPNTPGDTFFCPPEGCID